MSWLVVGCSIPDHYALGCHIPKNNNPDYGAFDCTNALDCDVMVGPRKNPRPWRANCSLTCRAKTSQTMNDNNCCVGVGPMSITTFHTLWLCRLF